jgi:TetR/AcrR family fatty acid metabolism transcriptional regulator
MSEPEAREKDAAPARRASREVRRRAGGGFAVAPGGSRSPAETRPARRPPRESAKDEARGAFRDAILAAAERVFARSGFYVTRMADIAKEAGVGVGTLYNYFESKELIFSDLLERRHEEFRRAVRDAAVAEDPVLRLRQIVERVFSVLGEKGELLAVFIERGAVGECDLERLVGTSAARDYGEFLALLDKTVREAVRAKKLRADVDARLLVSALAGAINAAIYSWLKRGRRGRLASVTDGLVDVFLDGARGR